MAIESIQVLGARLVTLDVFRGIVVLLLVPDVAGGSSFYAMARQSPDDHLWALLASWFTHVEWVGAAPWDLVMPGFVFAAGAAMALSVEQHHARGESPSLLQAHALVVNRQEVVFDGLSLDIGEGPPMPACGRCQL